MLSGIKTGKRKKQAKVEVTDESGDVHAYSKSSDDTINNENLSVAERLKQALAQEQSLQNAAQYQSKLSYMDRVTNRDSATMADKPAGFHTDTSFVVVDGPGVIAFKDKREEDMTATELAAKERTMAQSGMSWDEHIARDVVRVGKKRKLKPTPKGLDDSDEEVERMKKHLPDNDDLVKKSAKQLQKEELRERRRQISQYQQQEKITSLCSWWINSSSFTKQRLLAFGRHVSLMMAPLNASLIPGHQFYLVPLKHAPSFVDCDDDGVWEEVAFFRRSLENMYARERKGIILLETVLPSRGLWQTKMEVVPVPFSVLQDAPIFFKSSMIEQANEFGTHHKLFKTCVQKPLRNVIPKKFPYFAIDWGNIVTSRSTGYAQIIESSNFRHEFGLDTLAGMLELDPIRFQKKRTFPHDMEKRAIADFQLQWKAHDWTIKLEEDC